MFRRLGTSVVENGEWSIDFGIRQQNLLYCRPFDAGKGECSADWGPWWLKMVDVPRISGSDSKISCTVGHLALEVVNLLLIGDPGSGT